MTPQELIVALEKVVEQLPDIEGGIAELADVTRTRLRRRLTPLLDKLDLFSRTLDPVAQPPIIVDPMRPESLGVIIGDAMLEQPPLPLEGIRKFYGSGVYGLFYSGDFHAYRGIRDTKTPIYVGKADPPDVIAATPEEQGTRLWGRLNDHARSITKAENLDIADFSVRFLVIKSGFQVSAEQYLLNEFRPVWNEPLCNGFGKHGDSPSTRANTRSEWDTLHPGREWAWREGNTPNPKGVKRIVAEIEAHFVDCPPRE